MASLSNKAQVFIPAVLLKRDLNISVFCEICEIFKNTYFEERLFLNRPGPSRKSLVKTATFQMFKRVLDRSLKLLDTGNTKYDLFASSARKNIAHLKLIDLVNL